MFENRLSPFIEYLIIISCSSSFLRFLDNVLTSIDKELLGKVAAEIKMLKPVEPYKGKGITERGQDVLRKEGKKK